MNLFNFNVWWHIIYDDFKTKIHATIADKNIANANCIVYSLKTKTEITKATKSNNVIYIDIITKICHQLIFIIIILKN
jgi:hypothetical protein